MPLHFFCSSGPHHPLHSFPTRRSSDLIVPCRFRCEPHGGFCLVHVGGLRRDGARQRVPGKNLDRKSTRLNSSHITISYAVFCLKKKNIRTIAESTPTCNTTRKDLSHSL